MSYLDRGGYQSVLFDQPLHHLPIARLSSFAATFKGLRGLLSLGGKYVSRHVKPGKETRAVKGVGPGVPHEHLPTWLAVVWCQSRNVEAKLLSVER